MVELQQGTAILMGGIPGLNAALYHRVRFMVGDPTAVIQWMDDQGKCRTTFIVRDIEVARARQRARADHVASPSDYAPESGLSGDRETATAQAAAECLKRHGIHRAIADRSLPLLYADVARQQGIDVVCDRDLGVVDRRAKDAQEVDWLREAQHDTELAMQMACEMIAASRANSNGQLAFDAQPLTSESVRAAINRFLLEKGYDNPPPIVASGPSGADCHDLGRGPIGTGQPVIIDIFPRSQSTRYNGDCTRTVVHGDIPDEVRQMHAAVMAAKEAAERATRAGVTGEDVHAATTNAILANGYSMGLPSDHDPPSRCAMTHGTGHGIGLEVHEPPLLDRKGPPLVLGDALTIEPGLYCPAIGGVRVEDMVIVTEEGCENLNSLPTGLDWRP